MSTKNVFFRLIEKTISLLGSDRFLIVFGAPANSDWIADLLRRFPNVGIVVKGDIEGVDASHSARIGYLIGPDLGDWHMPKTNYRDVLIIGPKSEVRFRAVKTAISHRVRSFVFADPFEETLSSSSILVFAIQLIIKRVLNRGLLFVRSISALETYQYDYQRIPWTKPSPKALAYLVAQLKGFQEVFLLKKRRAFFFQTFEKLIQFADRDGPNDGNLRLPRVFLTIGTIGPGGSERQVVNTALALAAEGRFRPTVICTNLSGGTSEFYRSVLEIRD